MDPECLLWFILGTTTPTVQNGTCGPNAYKGPALPKIDWVVFNLVDWHSGNQAATSDWYLYDRWGTTPNPYFPLAKEPRSVSDTVRILGDTNVAFISVHVNAGTNCKISYNVTAKEKTAQNVQDVKALIQLAASRLLAGSSEADSTAYIGGKVIRGVREGGTRDRKTGDRPNAPQLRGDGSSN